MKIRELFTYALLNILIGFVLMVTADDFIPAVGDMALGYWLLAVTVLSLLSVFTLGKWFWKGWERLNHELDSIPEPESYRRLGKERAQRIKKWNL